MSSCGAVVGGISLDRVDIDKEAVIQGVVINQGQPAPVGYVRLHDAGDEFTAEVPLNSKGEFRFFAAPGDWTLVTLIPGASTRTKVSASLGVVTDLDVVVA